MTTEELLRTLHPTATRVANRVAKTFPGYVESADIYQDLIAWALENSTKVERWYEPDPEAPDIDPTIKGDKIAYTALRRLGFGVGHQAKADKLGYSVNDLHFYSEAMLEELLPLIYDYEEWLPTQNNDGQPPAKGDPALGGNKMAMLADVKRAYEAGSRDDRLLLWARYFSRESLDVLAVEYDVARRTIERRVLKALRRMNSRLGDSRPDFGIVERRRVISNDAAQYITQHSNDPDLPLTMRKLTR